MDVHLGFDVKEELMFVPDMEKRKKVPRQCWHVVNTLDGWNQYGMEPECGVMIDNRCVNMADYMIQPVEDGNETQNQVEKENTHSKYTIFKRECSTKACPP